MHTRTLAFSSPRLHALALVASSIAALAGCGDPTVTFNPLPPSDASTPRDATSATDATDAATDAARDVPFIDSGCPAPARVTPETPLSANNYLAPITVRFVRPVDGDTAHFIFPIMGEQTVRFLFVNTEESTGDASRITAFGTLTSHTVGPILQSGREFKIILQADPNALTQPNHDPYMRLLGLVYMDGELFQTRLVREGWSAYYTQFGCAPEPAHTALVLAEAEARANQRGIWQPGHPTDYRPVLQGWIGSNRCRPNPFRGDPYCR
jgi:endonuclease YncB( thermonuclease family)